MGGWLCGDSKNSEPQRSVTFLLLFSSPSIPTEYRGGIESICLQSHTLQRKYSMSETKWQETSYQCRIRQSLDLFPAQHHLLRKSMGSLRNFYCIKYCNDSWEGTAKVGRRCRLQTTHREQRGVYYSVLQELFFLSPKDYCRKVGFEGNMKWNSFLHNTTLHAQMKPLPYTLVRQVLPHRGFPAVSHYS